MSPILVTWLLLAQSTTPQATTPGNPIDAYFEPRWKEAKVKPAAASDDLELFRRLHLDLVGRLPSPDEIRAYLAGSPGNRRAETLNRLLMSEESSIFFADTWLYFLIDNDMAPRDVIRLDFGSFRTWLRARFYEDTPYPDIVRALISDRGSKTEKPAVNYALKHLADEPLPVKMATVTARIFLGRDIRCAQCHDHPFEAMTRDEFWSFVEFFRPLANRADLELVERSTVSLGRKHDELGEVQGLAPKFLDGRTPEGDGRLGEALAGLILSTKDHESSRAVINRVWKHFFGRKLTNLKPRPQDQPLLLDTLVAEFEHNGQSLRWLMKTILTSQTWQKTSAGSEEKRLAYAVGPIKPMTAIQFLGAFIDVFDLGEAHRQMREKAYNDPKFDGLAKDADVMHLQFIQWARDLLIPKGHDPEEAPAIGTVRMAIKFMNNKKINTMMTSTWGMLKKILSKKSKAEDRVDEIALSLWSRPPTPEERAELLELVDRAAFDKNGYEDVFWILVNSSEFLFNH